MGDPKQQEGQAASSDRPEPWALLQPPRGIILAAVFLWLLGSLGGIGMTVLGPQVRRMSWMWIMDRQSVHSLVGAMDYDAPIVNEIIFWIEAGLSFFHTHAEGMGLVVLAAGTVVSTWIASRALRIALHVLIALGAVFPFGYALYSSFIPFLGKDRGVELAEALVLIPFGSTTILAMGVIAAVLLVGLLVRTPAGAALPMPTADVPSSPVRSGAQHARPSRPWQVPPRPLMLAAVLLLALAETGGGLMGRYKTDIREFAREEAEARPAAHGLVGLADVDDEDLARVATLLDAALRLFHMHGEGMSIMLLGLGTIVQSALGAGRLRTLLHLLIGVGGFLYPLGYLAQAGLTPLIGVDRARSASRTLLLWPAGTVLIAGLALLAAVLLRDALRRTRWRWAPAAASPLLLAAVALLPATAWAHHTGTFIPGDTDLTANFKQIKVAAQGRHFDVALRLFDEGAFLDQVVELQDRLFTGLKEGLRQALRAENFARAELYWTAVMVYLARDRIQEARRRVVNPGLDDDLKMRHGQKILNGAWRYYNLVDLPISGLDPKAASSLKVAFEDGLYYLGSSLPDPMWTSGEVILRKETYNPTKAAQVLEAMERTLTRVYDQLAVTLTRDSGPSGAREGRWRGLITEITEDRISVRGDNGQILSFRPSERMGISPKHLREHMERKVKVTVRYRVEEGALRAVRITD